MAREQGADDILDRLFFDGDIGDRQFGQQA
jgi:hypothetical protein